MPVKDPTHVHSYVYYRTAASGTVYFKCDDPKCTHYTDIEFIRGKESLCPQCHTRTLVLDFDALRRKRPLCLGCRDTKEGKIFQKTEKILSAMFDENTGEKLMSLGEAGTTVENPELFKLHDDNTE